MLMQAQPVYDAWRAVAESIDRQGRRGPAARVIYLTPQGAAFCQDMARELAGEEDLIFLCGHYEGIDERVLEEIVTDQVSIGDYVLTGGELAAMVTIDALMRFVPGVLGSEQSAVDESFSSSSLEYPQYTRPPEFKGLKVPEVLLNGNHKEIARFRRECSEHITAERRADLLDAKRVASAKDGGDGH